MKLRPHKERGAHWLAAISLSVGLHGIGLYWALGVVPYTPPPSAPARFQDISTSSIRVESVRQIDISPASVVPEPLVAADIALPPDTPLAPATPVDLAENAAQVSAEVATAISPEIEQLAPRDLEQPADITNTLSDSPDLLSEDPDRSPRAIDTAAEIERISPVIPIEAVRLQGTAAADVPALELNPLSEFEVTSPLPSPQPLAQNPAPPATVLAPVSEVASNAVELAPEDQGLARPQRVTVTETAEAANIETPDLAQVQTDLLASTLPSVGLAVPDSVGVPGPEIAAVNQTAGENLSQILIESIRANLQSPCLVALPREEGEGSRRTISLISDRDQRLTAFERDVLSGDLADAELSVQSALIDPRQCPALDYVRSHPAYPLTSLDLELQTDTLISGNELTGSVENFAGSLLSLILIDDNGVVQDLRRYLQLDADRAVFSVPVRRDGPNRDTKALIMAIAAPIGLKTLNSYADFDAAQFFEALSEETRNRARVSVEFFDLRTP